MGVTGTLAAAASVASIYSAVKSSQRKDAPLVLPQSPSVTADQANAANTAAIVGARQKAKAAGSSSRASTILTGPQGVTTPAPGQKTLLGM